MAKIAQNETKTPVLGQNYACGDIFWGKQRFVCKRLEEYLDVRD